MQSHVGALTSLSTASTAFGELAEQVKREVQALPNPGERLVGLWDGVGRSRRLSPNRSAARRNSLAALGRRYQRALDRAGAARAKHRARPRTRSSTAESSSETRCDASFADESGSRRVHASLRAQPRSAAVTTRRFTVMGFTEAELGFVLAAVFAALAASALTPQQSTATLAARNDTLSPIAERNTTACRPRSRRTVTACERSRTRRRAARRKASRRIRLPMCAFSVATRTRSAVNG